MTRLTFGAWLKRQTGRRDPVGDLSRDYVAPCPCRYCGRRTSRRYSPAGVREDLDRHDAAPETYAALDAAADEWRKAYGGTEVKRANGL